MLVHQWQNMWQEPANVLGATFLGETGSNRHVNWKLIVASLLLALNQRVMRSWVVHAICEFTKIIVIFTCETINAGESSRILSERIEVLEETHAGLTYFRWLSGR